MYLSLISLSLVICRALDVQEFVADCRKTGPHRLYGTGSSNLYEMIEHELGEFSHSRRTLGLDLDESYMASNSLDAANAILKIPEREDAELFVFAATEVRFLNLSMLRRQHPSMVMFPVVAGPLAIIFNIPGVSNLTLSVVTLSKMYSGEIKYWDDAQIASTNPDLHLPREQIRPIARMVDSSTTGLLTALFASVHPEWRLKYGVFTDPGFPADQCCNSKTWPKDVIFMFGRTTADVATIVESRPYSIGYGPSNAARVQVAAIQNSKGRVTKADAKGVHAAIESLVDKGLDIHLHTDQLINSPNEFAYPLSYVTFFMFNQTTTMGISCCEMVELIAFIEFLMTLDGAVLTEWGLLDLPEQLKTLSRMELLRSVSCKNEFIYPAYLETLKPIPMDTTMQKALTAMLILLGLAFLALAGLLIYRSVMTARRNEETWHISSSNFKTAASSSGSVMCAHSKDATLGNGQNVIAQRVLNISKSIEWSKQTKSAMLRNHGISHQNILQFLGIIKGVDATIIIYDMPSNRRKLHDILQARRQNITENIRFCFARDVTSAVEYLHTRGVVHGMLSTMNCFVDASWNIKVGDWVVAGLTGTEGNEKAFKKLLAMDGQQMDMDRYHQMALLFCDRRVYHGVLDPQCDIFSLGLILLQIFTRKRPYENDVISRTSFQAFCHRKFTTDTHLGVPGIVKDTLEKDDETVLQQLITDCTVNPPGHRPSAQAVHERIFKLHSSVIGIVDEMMGAMERYTESLYLAYGGNDKEKVHGRGQGKQHDDHTIHVNIPSPENRLPGDASNAPSGRSSPKHLRD